MKTAFKKSFVKDLKTHSKNKNLLDRIQKTILEIEGADSITAEKFDRDADKKVRLIE